MKAMILAAGLGTRLKPLTDSMPKALVEIDGVPMLERVILKLKSQGFDYIVINVHHFAGMVKDFLAGRDYGVKIVVSDESSELLDTGGGIVKASPLIFQYDDSPVLIHNVDILSNMDLIELYSLGKDVSSLLVSNRQSSRKLLFDKDYFLAGWHDLKNNRYRPEIKTLELKSEAFPEYAFGGIYTLTKSAIHEMQELLGVGKYSVMDYFLSEKRQNPVRGFLKEDLKILDIGKPDTLSQAIDFL